jgi:hypothetical protein
MHLLFTIPLASCLQPLASPRVVPAAAVVHRRASDVALGARGKPPPLPAKYVPEGRLRRGGLPDEVFEKTNFATGGARTAETVSEIEQNWKAFKTCFASEKLAIEAAKKKCAARGPRLLSADAALSETSSAVASSAVFSPQFSSPTKIKGTYKLLCRRLGKQETAALLMKNPGVLCNSPAGLEKCTDKEILDAAEYTSALPNHGTPGLQAHTLRNAWSACRLVATVDANKPIINALAGLVIILVIAAGVYRGTVVNPGGAIAGFDASGQPVMRNR